MSQNIKLSDFNYKLPKGLVAKYPVDPRSSSRMMIIDKETGDIRGGHTLDLLSLLHRNDCIVLNETKVYPSKIYGIKEKTNAQIEIVLLRELKVAEEHLWDILVEPARKVREGNKIYFDGHRFCCEVINNTTSRGRTVKFICEGDIYKHLERQGEMFIPAYIERAADAFDKKAYQTEFANDSKALSIAPPTAGLHFTTDLLNELEHNGVKIVKVNVNLGLGVFDEIKTEDLSKHVMYHEHFEISSQAAGTINKTLKSKHNVYAVGNSVVRALESSVLTTGQVKPNSGWADKFIYPPYKFKIVTGLLTNFHPPSSPSLLLACAFGGKDTVMKGYRKAIKEEYRFHAYGDAMLIM